MFALIMTNIGQNYALFVALEVMIFHVAGDVEVGTLSHCRAGKLHPCTAAHGNAAHLAVEVSTVSQVCHLKRLFHSPKNSSSIFGVDITYHSQSCIFVAVLQSDYVKGRLLIGMGFEHRCHYPATQGLVDKHLYPNLGLAMQAAHLARVGIGTIECTVASLASKPVATIQSG